MKIFDLHVHIYPDKIAERASGSIGGFYPGYRTFGNGMLKQCLELMDEAGIDMFAAHSVAVIPRSIESVNSFIWEAYHQAPDRIVPFGSVHPDAKDVRGIVHSIADLGFRGIKIHPDMQHFRLDEDRAMPMMEAISETGLPLLIHCGDYRYDNDGPERILSLHRLFPKLRMLCAHFGGWMEWDSAAALLPGHRLDVDCSSSLFHWNDEEAAAVIRKFGTKHVFYATDYPMWHPKTEVDRVLNLPLTQQEKEDILWNNAARLFQL